MPAETGNIRDVPPLNDIEKYSIEKILADRVSMLLRSKKIASDALFDAAQRPISTDKIVLVNTMKSVPSFFSRTVEDLVQEIRGVLQGHFDICKQLGIISVPRYPVQRTAEEFDFIKTTFVDYANKKFNELFPEQNHNDKMNLI